MWCSQDDLKLDTRRESSPQFIAHVGSLGDGRCPWYVFGRSLSEVCCGGKTKHAHTPFFMVILLTHDFQCVNFGFLFLELLKHELFLCNIQNRVCTYVRNSKCVS